MTGVDKVLPEARTDSSGNKKRRVMEGGVEATTWLSSYEPYVAYIHFLQKKAEDEVIAISANNNSNYGYNGVDQLTGQTGISSLAFRDLLQAPLQPLIDDLESKLMRLSSEI